MKNAKNKWWGVKDYIFTILLFALHVAIVIGFCVLTIYLNGNGKQDFLNYFNTRANSFYNLTIEMIILCGVVYVYFALEHGDFLFRRKNTIMLIFVLEISLIANYLIGRYLPGPNSISIYARPVALSALLSLYLIGSRKTAIFMNIVVSLMTFVLDIFTNSNIEWTVIFASLVLNFTTGIVAVYSLDGITNRFRIFFSGIFISLPAVICVFGLEFINVTSISGNLRLAFYALASGILSVVLMMMLLPFFEIVFNVVTDFRLSEITSTSYKYMKELREQAPGTFNHCITVATLSENCAASIGENVLKARAAAYYHDLGKLKEPEFFAENQKGYNPLDELSPELATDIIRSHARVGSEFIKERNLPEFLADVASEHHGTLPIKYFFAKAKKYTENEVDIKDFSYSGPKPQTKIASIIMICDASEAKVRTMNDRSAEKVDKAVKDIIEERMELEQFTDCDITLRELEIIRESIVTTLAGVYHSRVKYPKLKIKKEELDD